MADKADIAGDYIEQSLEMALENQRNQPKGTSNDPYCEECGTEIPAKRREALPGCATCVDCQQLLEVKTRNYR
jgi:phage/conjugal plasmid C-4 type zinc finger TraR family protein